MKRFAMVSLVIAACSPGSSTVTLPDSGVTDTSALPDSPATLDTSAPVDTNVAPTDATTIRDTAEPEPDLGPMPSRMWTAETDGTIGWWTFDPAANSLVRDGEIERGGALNFLALSADRTKLYAINGSRVEAFDISTLPPTFIGDADAGLADTGTHLAVDATNSHVFVAWYGGDAVSVLPLDDAGAPSDATMVFGGAADPNFCRRAHQVRIHPNNQFVYVPCLASDHVVGFAYDSTAGTVDPIGSFATDAGTGPRHMDFHPTLSQAYVIGESADSITRFAVDDLTGSLAKLDTVSTLPNAGDPIGPASDIHVSPDGTWVVGINRNPRDEVVTFAVGGDGSLSAPRWVSTGGMHARTFAFAPRGQHLLVGNSNSQDLSIFTFDNGTAALVDTVGGFDARLFFVGFQ